MYSHWMGVSDLGYCLGPGEPLCVVLAPRYVAGGSVGVASVASLAWVGGADHAPRYQAGSIFCRTTFMIFPGLNDINHYF